MGRPKQLTLEGVTVKKSKVTLNQVMTASNTDLREGDKLRVIMTVAGEKIPPDELELAHLVVVNREALQYVPRESITFFARVSWEKWGPYYGEGKAYSHPFTAGDTVKVVCKMGRSNQAPEVVITKR